MIQQLQKLFRSITKSLEVLYVIEGVKPCARILVHEDELNKIISFLNEAKLSAAISDFKVLKKTAQSEFYSDKSIKIPKGSAEKGHFIVYLSKGKKTPEKAKITEERSNHRELGLLLGYPKCCCDFFADHFNENNADLTLKVLENSRGYKFPFYNNIAARHFDISLLSHFPHSFECKPSIKIARSNLKTMQRHSKQLAVMFAGLLQGIVIYTTEEGVFLLRKYEMADSEVIYGNVLTTAKSKLYFLLSSNNRLRIADKNNFFVSDVNIKGAKYGVIVFT